MLEQLFPCRQLLALEADLLAASEPAAMPVLAQRIANLAQSLIKAGNDGLLVTQLISALNDRLTARLLELLRHRHRLPDVDWCWLALGSEGRQEQTLVTDQDNALIFSATDPREAAALRSLFQPFASDVNQQLAACGFQLCPGGIMAGNADWCLSFDEWRERFIDWVRRPDPQALLNASIFFDLRPLFGALHLGERLQQLFLSMTCDTPAFLHLMAANALQADVPLGFRGEPQTDEAGVIDLKKFGSRIFVDAARIFALAAPVSAVGSVERMLAAGRANGLQEEEIPAVNAAFAHLLRLRLQGQVADAEAGNPPRHGLKLNGLHEVDQAILKEALRQARRLQQRLKLNYAL